MNRRPVALMLLCLVSTAAVGPSRLIAAGQAGVRDAPGRAPTGTSAIVGVVVSAEAQPRPIARAIVTITSSALSSGRSTISDEGGRFAFLDLPSGSFTVVGRKAAYVNGAYGATRPGRPGTPISIAAGQRAEIRMLMARGGVITGTLRDASGRPLPNAQVGVISTKDPRLEDFFTTGQFLTTDDRGVYRIFGVTPGDYVVAAFQRLMGSGEIGVRRTAEMDATLAELQRRSGSGALMPAAPIGSAQPPGRPAPAPLPDPPGASFAPTYFPGTQLFSAAERVRVAAGEERAGVDFSFIAVRAASIAGVVTNVTGLSLSSVEISINSDGPRLSPFLGSGLVLSTPPGPDGAFKYTNVAPGRYTLMVRARTGAAAAPASSGRGGGGASFSTNLGGGIPSPAGMVLYAVTEADVSGGSVVGLTLALQPGISIAGRVIFDATMLAAPESAEVSKVRILFGSPGGSSSSMSNGTLTGNAFSSVSPPAIQADGRFIATNVAPGPYLVRAQLPTTVPPGWWLRSVIANGVDLLDGPLDIGTTDLSDVVVSFSDRHSELAGTLQTPGGQPAPDFYVVVFTADRRLWRTGARRVQVTRPDTRGAFSVRDLPAGEYFIAALTDIAEGEWNDPAFLAQLMGASVTVTVTDGGKTVQDLRITR